LAAGGWLRNLRFSGKKAAAESVGVATETDSASGGKSDELSVEAWVAEVLSADAPPAVTESLTVPSIECAAYTLNDERIGILV
jgi:hypothetical protein